MIENLTLKEEARLYLSYGNQTPESIDQIIRSMGTDIIFCSDTARMAGATLAAGTAQALYDLRQRLKPSAVERQKMVTPSLSEEANVWLSQGRRSLATDSVFQFLTETPLIHGRMMLGYPYHPKTVEDMKKCLQLLEAVPDLRTPFTSKMASASRPWEKLTSRWAELASKVSREGRMIAQVALIEALEAPDTSELAFSLPHTLASR
ncbi:hypothetical protein DZC30_18725 [Comamonas testosteroni]|uniref:Uncharacterized protein n=1 Tax=Comamonas testosteroni TaxID=285 RepID=A0A373FB22_COMTE|nr:hypothetical protein [Comamonas testosteroni]RGE41344.1 hypothetical protein DZC30_18725 [Comamonas testosteroni]